MLRLRHLSNKFQKRTLRVLYGQTQAYPYAAVLDDSFRDADGSVTLEGTRVSGATAPTRTADASTLKGGLLPGLVAVLVPGTDKVKIATGAADEQPFGLLANFVGGDLDEVGDENEVGVWRSGQGGVFELLAPAFGDVDITATDAGDVTPLFAGPDGRLTTTAGTANRPVANLLQVIGTSRIVVDMKV
jgi:hypothetical protein